MKKLIIVSLIILAALAECTRRGTTVPEGTWKMVQMQMIEGSKVTNYFSDRYNVSQIKTWSGNHFMFVGRYQVDTTTSYRFGVGTFTLKGNLYTEDILYHFDKSYEGRKNMIWLEIKNDTLLHVFPVNDAGEPNKNRHWVEKYVRL